ncbi:MAG: hypothetical protein J5761_05585 [Paludibacteraceae bacterium]|nr:hypothetical protein [Paludibacteraceae bacterium]
MEGPTAIFYGWDVVQYMRYLIDAYIRQFPWEVQLSFGLIALSVLTILVLFILFSRKAMMRQKREEEYKKCKQRYESAFREILQNQKKLSQEEMEYICHHDRSQLHQTDSLLLARLLVKLKMEQTHKLYIPNMQRLCRLTGVKDALETNLLKHRDVERTLQILMYLPCRVSEGSLAVYLENKDPRIRELARAYFGFCSKAEPFAMVTRDVNEPFNLWYPTIFHRLCGWHVAKGHPMPHFASLISQSTNEDKKALFISEVPYWGTEDEKRGLREFLNSSSKKCCSAAIRALALIGDPEAEDELVRNYNELFPAAKRETLRAIANINTGRQVEFFREAYLHSTSQKTRAVALSCLFRYGPEGRKVFDELAHAGRDESRFFQQISTTEERMVK